MLSSAPLAPLSLRSYRFQWPADLLVSWAFEMETLILGWYVLVETNSVVMLTVFGALLYGGTLIAPIVGVWSDRLGHRNMLSAMRAVYALVAGTLMTLAFTGRLTPMIVLILAAITGIVRPSDMGLRGALIADTMPPASLTPAMGIARTTSDTARIFGALTGAGLFAAIGIATELCGDHVFLRFGSRNPDLETPSRRARHSRRRSRRRSGVKSFRHAGALGGCTAGVEHAAAASRRLVRIPLQLCGVPIEPMDDALPAKEIFDTNQTGSATWSQRAARSSVRYS